MKNVVFALFLGSSMSLGASTSAQVISVEDAPVVTGVDGADLYRARHVLQRFFANERHPECYRIVFSAEGANLRVDFAPKQPYPFRYEGEPERPNLSTACRRAGYTNVGYVTVGYIVDSRGNVLRRVHSR